jgi:hypothetical protein
MMKPIRAIWEHSERSSQCVLKQFPTLSQTVPIADEWSGRTSKGDREGEENGRLQRRLLAMVFFAACFVLCSTTTEFAGHV